MGLFDRFTGLAWDWSLSSGSSDPLAAIAANPASGMPMIGADLPGYRHDGWRRGSLGTGSLLREHGRGRRDPCGSNSMGVEP